MKAMRKDQPCEICEEERAIRRLILVDESGAVLDEEHLCADCIGRVHVREQGDYLVLE
jgi:hypothetical protein